MVRVLGGEWGWVRPKNPGRESEKLCTGNLRHGGGTFDVFERVSQCRVTVFKWVGVWVVGKKKTLTGKEGERWVE